MKALMKDSMLAESVGMVGTYWKEGRRKADAGSEVGSPEPAMGIERLVFDGSRGESFCEGGDAVGWMEVLVRRTLW